MPIEARLLQRNGSVYVHDGCHTRALDLRTGQDVRTCANSDPTLFAAAVAMRSEYAREFVERFARRLAGESGFDERSVSVAFADVAADFRTNVGDVNATVVVAHDGSQVALQAGTSTCAAHVSRGVTTLLTSPLDTLGVTLVAAYGAPPPPGDAHAYDIIPRSLGAHPQPVHTITSTQWTRDDVLLLGTEPLVTVFAREVERGVDVDLALAIAAREHSESFHLVGVLLRAI